MQSKPTRRLGIALLRFAGLYHFFHDMRRDRQFRESSRERVTVWENLGRPAPPPDIVKYACIRRYARSRKIPIFVETGTFKGNAIFSLRNEFREIHSIELSEELYVRATKDLGHLKRVHLHLGDSTVELPRVAAGLKGSALYWLDGHFCSGPSARGAKDTPIFEELSFLLSRPPGDDVVLVDDARLFSGRDGYPTVEELRSMVAAKRPGASFEVRDDIIRIVPV